jgi:hypothetical protein
MTKCEAHREFFDDLCSTCRQEYLEMKSCDNLAGSTEIKKYNEFTENRAKKLYEDLMLQYLKTGVDEIEANNKAKGIVRKQCSLRRIPYWSWL